MTPLLARSCPGVLTLVLTGLELAQGRFLHEGIARPVFHSMFSPRSSVAPVFIRLVLGSVIAALLLLGERLTSSADSSQALGAGRARLWIGSYSVFAAWLRACKRSLLMANAGSSAGWKQCWQGNSPAFRFN